MAEPGPACVMALLFSGGAAMSNASEPKRSTEITYINLGVPSIRLPGYEGERYGLVYANGRYLSAMTIYYLLTGDQLWQEAGRRVVDGLHALATHERDKAYFDWVQYAPGKQAVKADPSTVTHNFASWFAWTVEGLANYYRVTGYEPAKTLSGRIARWIIADSNHFDPEGRFLREHPGTDASHFHGHTMVLLGLLHYALAAGDTSVADFVRRSFEFAKDHGNTVVGYFPEWLHGGMCETCETAVAGRQRSVVSK